jgi:site-specific DNA-methyltransferase (adenine-specific)
VKADKRKAAKPRKLSPVLFSSKSEDWATPRALAAELVKEFGITHDVCASAENAVVPSFWTKDVNALRLTWPDEVTPGDVLWMNPPYGRGIGEWVMKAQRCAAVAGVPVVCLLPARTDTAWWQDWIVQGTCAVDVEVRFLRGRLHFNESKNPAPFPSAVVIFRPKKVPHV